MAKGQISDEELSSGLKGLGGFGALGGARVVKDSPFRDSRSEPKVVDVARAAERPVVVKKAPVEPERSVVVEAKQTVVKATPKPRQAETPAAVSKADAKARRVADIYTERVTLQLSPEMRDKVDALARELQRARTAKGERITANTVMRVAVALLIEKFKLGAETGPNGEEELLGMVRAHWR